MQLSLKQMPLQGSAALESIRRPQWYLLPPNHCNLLTQFHTQVQCLPVQNNISCSIVKEDFMKMGQHKNFKPMVKKKTKENKKGNPLAPYYVTPRTRLLNETRLFYIKSNLIGLNIK